ncbi:MAG: DUF87 domain-containing protein [Armatimonadota bacterium]
MNDSDLDLFPRGNIVGVFRGFTNGGMEFHADLVLPYRSDFQNIPMHGQFLLVQLETPDEAVLGRIASLSSEGKLSDGSGEEFSIRAVQENRPVPEDLRQQYLKYKVDIRVLGVVRREPHNKTRNGIAFAPSHRRLPHVGSPVAFPSGAVLQEIAGHNGEGAALGHFALGEYIYSGGSEQAAVPDWAQVKGPEVLIKFPIHSLVARRTFIFARAGFGKSNLNKLLFSNLYRETPYVVKRGDRKVPVGTVIFDPDGEYFWPDDKGRPGLCDVPHLRDKVVVFTSRVGPSPFYQSFVAGGIKLDIRQLRPSDVIGIAVASERQEQQNVRKLKDLSQSRWEKLVDLVALHGNQTPLPDLCDLLDLDPVKQEMEALASRANMTAIVRTLHDKSSQLMDMLLLSLREGKLCVVDVSQMRGMQALMLSGLILRRIFDRNQEEFTAKEPQTIPTIAVVEEAQSVLREGVPASEPYIAWVKEGRKYDLGVVLVTQQPGSIPAEILSQGDNWFLFHLLSAGDLGSVKRANAHFSDDLLGALLNEPIQGQGVFWSSVGGKPYPVALRALSFEKGNTAQDPRYDQPAADTFAQSLKERFRQALQEGPGQRVTGTYTSYSTYTEQAGHTDPNSIEGRTGAQPSDAISLKSEVSDTPAQSTEGGRRDGEENSGSNSGSSDSVDSVRANDNSSDPLTAYKRRAIEAFGVDAGVQRSIRAGGLSWARAAFILEDALPATLDNRGKFAYNLVREALIATFGPEPKWETFKNESGRVMIRVAPEEHEN